MISISYLYYKNKIKVLKNHEQVPKTVMRRGKNMETHHNIYVHTDKIYLQQEQGIL